MNRSLRAGVPKSAICNPQCGGEAMMIARSKDDLCRIGEAEILGKVATIMFRVSEIICSRHPPRPGVLTRKIYRTIFVIYFSPFHSAGFPGLLRGLHCGSDELLAEPVS